MQALTMLTVTDADLALAAKLGLALVREAETDDDREAAAHPLATRAPQSWRVRNDKGFLLGQFRITAADRIYASKIHHGAWTSRAHVESINEVIRWIAPIVPVVRHVRTGTHDGTETVTLGGKTFDRPRALTECGAAATGGDYSPTAAKVELRDGSVAEMCPTCRAALESRGHKDLSKLSGRRGSATDKQRNFLRHLLEEGARHGRPRLMDARDLDKLSNREASALIDELKSRKARGWK